MIRKQEIIKQIKFLPPFSKIAQKAMVILQSDDFDMKSLAEVIRLDPALTANILKTVNSAYFAHSKEITDILTAVNFLGKDKLYNIVVISASKKYFPKLMNGYEANQSEIWEHSLSVALISERLLFLEPQVNPGEVFTAGLLHDIGKIVLSQFVNQEMHQIYKLVDAGKNFLEAEKEVLGFTHSEIGASILAHWKFSANIVASAQYYHHPEIINNPVVNIISLATLISMQLGKCSQNDSMAYAGLTHLLKYYNIGIEQFQIIISEAVDATQEILEKLK